MHKAGLTAAFGSHAFDHPLVDLIGHGGEALAHVRTGPRRCLHKPDPVLLRQRQSLLGGDFALAGEVGFVSDEELVDIGRGEFIDFGHPVLDGLETLDVCDVVHDDDSMGPCAELSGEVYLCNMSW